MLLLALATALVTATALAVAWRFGDRTPSQLAVAVPTLAFGEVVAVSLVLSPGDHLTRGALLVAVAVLFVATLPLLRGIRVPDSGRLTELTTAMRDPVLLTAAIVAVGVLAYSLALALFVPPSDQDALEYHLARAAFWRQQHAISYIPGAGDERLSSFPPNAEIVMAFTMITSSTGRFAQLVELIAVVGAAAAVYGVGRRLGLAVAASLFGALLFVSLPVVALQAGTALNDVVVAWLAVAAAFFLLRTTPFDLALAALATALLVGTKLTGPLAVPALAVLGLVASRRRLLTLAALAAGVACGAVWYVVNLVETGEAVGGFAGGVGSNVQGAAGYAGIFAPLARTIRLALAALEAPGAVGLDRLFLLAAAVCVAAFALAGARSLRRRGVAAGVAAAVVLVPFAIVPLGKLLVRANEKAFYLLGRGDVGYLDPHRDTTRASPIFSWYGPAAVVLVLVTVPLVVRAVRARKIRAAAVVVCLAPLAWVVLLGLFVPYAEWNGRYTMGGVAVGAATWGVALWLRPVAVGAVALAAVTSVLIMVHRTDRPAGIRLLASHHARSVWTLSDRESELAQTPYLVPLLGFVERHVRPGETIAVTEKSRGRYVPPYPLFGRDLTRRVAFARTPAVAEQRGADWAILARDAVPTCARGWRRAFRDGDLVVLRRAPASRCRGSS